MNHNFQTLRLVGEEAPAWAHGQCRRCGEQRTYWLGSPMRMVNHDSRLPCRPVSAWMHRCLERLQERRAARAHERRMNAARDDWYASARLAQIKACSHVSRTDSPEATSAAALGWKPQTCNDCGIGILTIRPSSPKEDTVMPICPECDQGKHGNCDGTAWDHAEDELAICTCTHEGNHA